MKWLKRKNKKTLYASFKEKNQKAEEVELLTNDTSIEVSSKKEKKKKLKGKELLSQINKATNRTQLITVASLKNGIGCTHICNLLKKYIESKGKKAYVIKEFDNIFSFYDNYDYLIIDYGYKDISSQKEYILSDIKIMLCLLDDTYLQNLYNTHLTSDKWYFFNHVPKNKRGKVDAIMEDYNYICVPVCSPDSLDTEIKRGFAKVLNI